MRGPSTNTDVTQSTNWKPYETITHPKRSDLGRFLTALFSKTITIS